MDPFQLSEIRRIKTLKKYDILDTPPDGSFDRITKLAAKLLDVPIAIITLVDTDRIWFKSRYGIDVQQIDRDPGLCASAILNDDLYLVEDAATDLRTLANPLVASKFGLRFYAAVPIKVRDGSNLGTLCIIDKEPRHLTETQEETLHYLTDILVDQLELRLAARTANSQQKHLLNVAAHDLKNPLTAISLWAGFICEATDNPSEVETICNNIRGSVQKMNWLINNLLEAASKEFSNVQLLFKPTQFAGIIERVVTQNQVLAKNKNINLKLTIKHQPKVNADEEKLSQVADNLVNNAIKYSPKNKNIHITLSEKRGMAILIVEDEGQGLTSEDKKMLFQRFARLSAVPTGKETATGLGLFIVKSLVSAHKGTITAKSEGKDKGTAFIVKVPVLKEL